MILKKIKIVTRVIASFIIILVLSIATITFLIQKATFVDKIVQSLFKSFNIVNNFLESKVDIANSGNILNQLNSAIESKDLSRTTILVSDLDRSLLSIAELS